MTDLLTDDPTTPEQSEPGPGDSRARGRLAVVAGLLAMLLIAEACARVVGTQLLDASWPLRIAAHLDHIDEITEDADSSRRILVLGSSSAGSGIDPAQLDDTLGDSTTYNFWLAGTSMRALEAMYDAVLESRFEPDTVVIGLTSREMNDTGEPQGEGYESLIDSTGVRRANGDQGTLDEIDEWVSERSTLVRDRRTLTDPARFQEELRQSGNLANIRADGMLTDRLARSEPLITERHLQQEREALEPYAVGGRETTALRALVEDLERNGVDVVIVTIPVLDDFVVLHPNGAADLDAFTAAARSVAADAGVPFVDAAALDWERSMFGDENHLNGRGAARLTEVVADALR